MKISALKIKQPTGMLKYVTPLLRNKNDTFQLFYNNNNGENDVAAYFFSLYAFDFELKIETAKRCQQSNRKMLQIVLWGFSIEVLFLESGCNCFDFDIILFVGLAETKANLVQPKPTPCKTPFQVCGPIVIKVGKKIFIKLPFIFNTIAL